MILSFMAKKSLFLIIALTIWLALPVDAMGENPDMDRELIALAEEKIKAAGYVNFDSTRFPRVKISESNGDVHVSFGQKVYFYPLNTVYLYGAEVRLEKEGGNKSAAENHLPIMSLDIKRNPETLTETTNVASVKCFAMSPSVKEGLDFVVKAINKSGKASKLDLAQIPDNLKMTVTEYKDYYQVEIDWQYHSYYKINKKTGELYDEGHKHYTPYRKKS